MSDIVERLRTHDWITWSIGMEEAADEIERLRAEQKTLRNAAVNAADERDALSEVLVRNGFRKCDIPACNCGSWHHVGGFAERFREIDDATVDDWRNGETLLARITRIAAERDALKADADRYRYIRDNHETRGRAMEIVYGMNGSDWDAAIDAARKETP